MEIEQLHKLFSINKRIDTDTRRIRSGSLFFALKGDNFNGNKFAQEAIIKGASYAIIDEKEYIGEHTILVADVLETLQKLANYHRNTLSTTVIALTGSNGKTTTKELIKKVLAKKYSVKATEGNLNNHIGVPLTLLSFDEKTDIGIVEMGANHLKEIELLSKIANPNFGLITNFGKAHIEGFGSEEGVIQGKSELYEYLRMNKGKVFINTDDDIQVKQAIGIDQISFNNKIIQFLEASPFVKVKFKNEIISSKLIGKYNFNNISVAIVIGQYFEVSTHNIKEAIENYIPTNNRSQIIQKGTNKIILDAYNANPSSMEAALENFTQLKAKQKIVFLGDMFELGSSSEQEHQKIADIASASTFTELYLIGKAFSTTNAKNAFIFKDFESLKNSNPMFHFNNTTILIKGSRGMALERILNLL